MPLDLQVALDQVLEAAGTIFDADPGVRSVGVGKNGDDVGFFAVRNSSEAVAFAGGAHSPRPLTNLKGVPVHYINAPNDPVGLARVPHSGPASPGVGSLVQEQQFHRPLVCGLQLQNYDDDVRTGEITKGYMFVGTLGCFVNLANGSVAMLSNNHVLAGENRGVIGQDRILQPGGVNFQHTMLAGVLEDFVKLTPSPAGASMVQGNVHLNTVDAATATVAAGQVPSQTYLPLRAVTGPIGVGTAAVSDEVYKVGRTTALTHGIVTQVGTVSQVRYGMGTCWFQQSIVIEGVDGALFSDHGDSGSAIVRKRDHALVGLLYAGNGTQTYACPIDQVMSALNCTLR
ncbi:hypothetical protein [Paraburkholderia sp. SIMBA_053]|uniref:hypothetical protein n=1 Tax=Paraburkholderia sp. SIMBA_053 TaxID=3085794 RepID=UPI00397DE674